MTAKLFARPIRQTVFPSEVHESKLASILARGTKLLDGETPTCIYVVEGGHVVEGQKHAALIKADGSVTLATIAEAKCPPDEEPEDDEEGDEEDDADEEPEDDEEDDDEEESIEEETALGREHYTSIASAISGTGLPRKLKTMAAEALAARFEELPGSFDRSRFMRTAVLTAAEDEGGEDDTAEGINEVDGDLAERRKMREKGYRYIIRLSGSSKRSVLYAKTVDQASRLMRQDYPDEKDFKIERLDMSEGTDEAEGKSPHAQAKARFKHAEQRGLIKRKKLRMGVTPHTYRPGKPKPTKESIDEATLTRQHFAMIAQSLAELDMPLNYKKELVGAVAGALSGASDRFQHARFVKATGLTPSQVSEPETASMESELFITYCDEGVQLVRKDKQRLALVRCNTESHVDSARAINAVAEYAGTLGYQHVMDETKIDEGSIDESALIEMEWDAIDDLRAVLALVVESSSPEEIEQCGATLRAIDEAINEGDFELAEELAEPLLEYKRMGQSARRMRIRSLRMGIPKSVRAGRTTRAEHRRGLLKRRRTYRTSAGMRSKAKRYSKRTARFRARLRPLPGSKSESVVNEDVRGLMKRVSNFLYDMVSDDDGSEGQDYNDAAETIVAIQRRPTDADTIEMAKNTISDHYADHPKGKKLLAELERAEVGESIARHHAQKRETGEGEAGLGEAARKPSKKALAKEASAKVDAAYGKYFDRVPVSVMDLGKIRDSIESLITSGADLDAEVPKLVQAYRKESVDEAGDKIGALAEEVMTYLINRPTTNAELLMRQFRVTSTAANAIMAIAAQALAVGKEKGGYVEHVKAIGNVLAQDNAFESGEGEHRRPFVRKGTALAAVLEGGDVFAKHSTKIALSTLKMHALGARLMGGMNHAQAVTYLTTKAGYSADKVRGLLKKAGHDDADIDAMFKSAEAGEDVDVPESVDEALALPTNSKHTIVTRWERPGDDEPRETEVPAFKLAKATVFMPGGYGWVKHEVNDLVMWQGKYAQYTAALHVQFRQRGKRKTVTNAYGYKPRVIVFDGWGIDLDVEDPFEPEVVSGGVSTRKGKRLSQDPGWDDEMLARISNYKGKAPAVSIVEGECAWTELDEETGKPTFDVGDLVTLGANRSRKYLVLSKDKFGNVHGHALTGTEKGSHLSGALPSGVSLAKVGTVTDAQFSGRMAARLRIKAEQMRQMLKSRKDYEVFVGDLPGILNDPRDESDATSEGLVRAGNLRDLDALARQDPAPDIDPDSLTARAHIGYFDGARHGVCEGKAVPPIDSPIYQERVKFPKYSVKISPLNAHGSDGGKILARRLQGWTKADHLAAAVEHDKRAKELESDWAKTADAAAQATWGRDFQITDYRISGIGSDTFSDEHKTKLRYAAQTKGQHLDAKHAHLAAAKMRSLAKDESDDPEYDALVEESERIVFGVYDREDTLVSVWNGRKNAHLRAREEGEADRSAGYKVKRLSGGAARNAIRQLGEPKDHADESTDESKTTKVRSAALVQSMPGFTVGMQPDGTAILFRREHYDNKGTVSGPSVVLGKGDEGQRFYDALWLDWNIGFENDYSGGGGSYTKEEHAKRRARAVQLAKKLPKKSDEALDMDANDEIERLAGGPEKAFKLMRTWERAQRSGGTALDRLMNDHDPAKTFRRLAKEEGFSTRVINAYLNFVGESVNEGAEDDLTNAIFNGTKVGAWFKKQAHLAGDMIAAVNYDGFECDTKALAMALRTGGEIDGCTFQGSKAQARQVAQAMIGATEESIDEGRTIEYEGYKITKDADDNYRVTAPNGETWSDPAANVATAKKWVEQHIAEVRQRKSDYERGAKGKDEGLDEALANGKVSTFRLVGSSIFTQYDVQQAARAAKKRGGYHNANAMGHYFKALDDAFEFVKGKEDSEDPATLKKLIAGIEDAFETGFPPAKKLIAQIQAFIDTGKKPTIVGQFKESIDEGVELPDGRVFSIKLGAIVERAECDDEEGDDEESDDEEDSEDDTDEGIKKKLDFGEYSKKVRSWDDKKLHYALVDISKTLPASDSMDRANGDSSEGGYYRDEASVIRNEIERRRKGGKREVAEEREYSEAEYNVMDEAKRKKMKGYWRTTKGGQRIFIENGKVTKGNPHLMRALGTR